MRKIKILLLAVITLTCASLPASAQFKWGLQAGIVANDLKFNNKLFDASNRVGFTGGLTAQFDLPFGLAFQGSLMYVHRTSEYTVNSGEKNKYNADYLTLPIHIKYNISIPAVSGLVRPFLFTGPSFSYLLSKRSGLKYGLSKGDIEWDLGLGVDIVKHLQLSIGYGIGCYKIAKITGAGDSYDTNVRTNSWTVTLGYLF